MSKRFKPRHCTAGGGIAAAILLSACGGSSSSDSSPALEAQAIDGYLVGSSVFCDVVENGGTAAAGRFSCPAGTKLFRIVGGADVGLDETATSGGIPFIGELKAPSNLAWVTPLSTIAVELSSSEDGTYDPARFDAAVDSLAAALGQSGIDLSADASETTQLLQLNGQISQMLSAFVDTDADYAETGRIFASLVADSTADGTVFSLTDGVGELVTRLNTRLADNGSNLAKNNAELGAVIDRVQSANIAIASAARPDPVTVGGATTPPLVPVVTIDREESFVTISSGDDNASEQVTLEDFEDDQRSAATGGQGARYTTVLTDGIDYLSIGRSAFDVERALTRETVSLGFELVATDDNDPRSIAVTTSEARLTTTPRTDDMTMTLPEGSDLNVRSVDMAGTMTETTIRLATDHEFSSANEGIEISFWRIDERLEDEGFGDIVARDGNYRMTAVIGGVRIGESDNDVVTAATQRTVSTGDQVVTGSGFAGYVTFLQYSQ